MTTKRKYFTCKKYDGDDIYSWAVFRKNDVKGLGSIIFYGQAKPLACGMDRISAKHTADRLEKEEEQKRSKWNNLLG